MMGPDTCQRTALLMPLLLGSPAACLGDDYTPSYDDESTFSFDEMGRLRRSTCPAFGYLTPDECEGYRGPGLLEELPSIGTDEGYCEPWRFRGAERTARFLASCRSAPGLQRD